MEGQISGDYIARERGQILPDDPRNQNEGRLRNPLIIDISTFPERAVPQTLISGITRNGALFQIAVPTAKAAGS